MNKQTEEPIILQQGKKQGTWVLTHKKANIVVWFEEGNFNKTQKVVNIYDFPISEYSKIRIYMKEIGD
ncbi:hypothetical protein AB4865_10980 [Capnocytophaga sp. ARDL2]|uniref:hypothetical protein n=1 Tax=Capnocytophaga sp. ARDL2 TaxID=3238809 RepID=UPI00355679E7